MQLDKELCMKFPAVLRNKLLNKEIELPDTALIDYDRFLVYRAVERKTDDNHTITLQDFKSYFELNKTPRGAKSNYKKDSHSSVTQPGMECVVLPAFNINSILAEE